LLRLVRRFFLANAGGIPPDRYSPLASSVVATSSRCVFLDIELRDWGSAAIRISPSEDALLAISMACESKSPMRNESVFARTFATSF
jgi:hypothetical protein